MHRAGIGVHVRELYVRVFLVAHLLHHVAPEDAGFHHVGLLHRADLVRPFPRQLEGRPRNPRDLAFGVALRITSYNVCYTKLLRLPTEDREGQPIIFDSYDMSPVLLGKGKSARKAWFYFTENELTPGSYNFV